MVLNTKGIHNSFCRNFPEIAKQMPSKVLFVAVRSLRAKAEIVGNSTLVKNHHFWAQLSHCFRIIKQLFTTVSVASCGNLPRCSVNSHI